MCTSHVQQVAKGSLLGGLLMQQVKDHLCTSHAAGEGSLLWTFLIQQRCRIPGSLSNFLESKIGQEDSTCSSQIHIVAYQFSRTKYDCYHPSYS